MREYKKKRAERELKRYKLLYEEARRELNEKRALINRIVIAHTEKEIEYEKIIYELKNHDKKGVITNNKNV